MKIVFVALKYDYGIPDRGLSFEYYNFYDTLLRMGHDVEYFDFFTLFQLYGKEKMTHMLRDKVEEIKPDLMFTFLFSNEFDPLILKKITTETKTTTLNWFADDHWRFDTFSRYWAPCFTFAATTDPNAIGKYHAIGYRSVLLTQWGANPNLYKKKDTLKKYDVTFVGQAHSDRPNIIRMLLRRGIEVKTWGTYWNVHKWHVYARKLGLMRQKTFERVINSTRITQEELIQVFQTSRINLNISGSSRLQQDQIKGRNFEIPACGGFQLSGNAEKLEEYFVVGKEIVCYRTVDELAERIQYYLTHEEERSSIAEAGYQRVARDHTYEKRFHHLFKQMQME